MIGCGGQTTGLSGAGGVLRRRYTMSVKTVFTNARVIDTPSDDTFTVVVQDGRVQSIEPSTLSSTASQDKLAVDSDKIDLAGEWYIAPSLVDAHTHFTAWTLNLSRINLAGATSAKDAVELMRAAANEPTDDPLAPVIGRDL